MRMRYSTALGAVLGVPAALSMSSALAADVTLKVDIPRLPVAEYHRPYIAVWLERAADQSTAGQLAVWYDLKKKDNGGAKWLKDMRQWWRKGGRDLQVPADGVSGATRAPGEAVLNLGSHATLASLPPGDYQVVIEASRENGGREVLRVPLTWPVKSAQTAKAQGEGELGAVQLSAKP
jgi:hypothetical protein